MRRVNVCWNNVYDEIMYAEIMFMLKKLLVEKEHVELLCMLNWSMLNYMHDEIMYVEKLACWFQCISKYLHFEKFVGRTPTFPEKVFTILNRKD